MKSYEINASDILMKVDKLIKELDDIQGKWDVNLACNKRYIRRGWQKPRWEFRISEICGELSIFDWWGEGLSKHQLMDMRKFLREAIKLGYTGYVCFKVGASGCANGMWAHKELSTTGYSPNGACIYKSFTPDDNYWSICPDGNRWLPADEDCGHRFNDLKTIKAFENFIQNL